MINTFKAFILKMTKAMTKKTSTIVKSFTN